MTRPSMESGDVRAVLRERFGFEVFRPHQEAIVRAILAREDAFVVMPTGGGKSLCYQLPAHMMPGVCVVVSPLISLMKDQVDGAVANGLRAAFLNSALTAARKRQVEARLRQGELDLLYVSPERFAMSGFTAMLAEARLAFVAVDEAHCISEWGHDFRPDYLTLATLVKTFPNVPVTAFTATATPRVQADIIARLGLRRPHVVRASFNRPNLFYKVVPKARCSEQILAFVSAQAGRAGIVYRTTRDSVEDTADLLARRGIRALPYHAGLDDATRAANQDAFNRDAVDVIVATIAFGMGIDKSNVRFVLHADLPKNIEGYYQETGRSGRDGEPAICQLLFGYGDIPRLRFFIDKIEDKAERARARQSLQDMVRYATAHACRRRQLLNYFGDDYPERSAGSGEPCCDICSGEIESVDATRDAQILLSAMVRTGERFGLGHIVDVVTGADTERMRRLGHDRIKTYGIGREFSKQYWRGLADTLLAKGVMTQTGDTYPVLKRTPRAQRVLAGEERVSILRTRHAPPRRAKPTAEDEGTAAQEACFEALRAVRKTLATRQGVPPYVIFNDHTLREMARRLPADSEEFLGISGVGVAKLERYGTAFLEALAPFRSQAGPASTVQGRLRELGVI